MFKFQGCGGIKYSSNSSLTVEAYRTRWFKDFLIIVCCDRNACAVCRSWRQPRLLPTTVLHEQQLLQSNLWCRPRSRSAYHHSYYLQPSTNHRQPTRFSGGYRGDHESRRTKGFVVRSVSWLITTRNISSII